MPQNKKGTIVALVGLKAEQLKKLEELTGIEIKDRGDIETCIHIILNEL